MKCHTHPLSFRCLDSPNAIALGWTKLLANHTNDNVTAGVWYSYTIPVFEMNDTNTIRVRLRAHWVRAGEGEGEATKHSGTQSYGYSYPNLTS